MSLTTKEEDVQKMLAAQVHIGTRNMNHDMKEPVAFLPSALI